MKTVFISHPFAGDIENNKRKVYELVELLHKQYPQIIFISPIHMFSYMEGETPEQREEIMQLCFKQIDLCHEFWSFGYSKGCKRELRHAISKSKSILVGLTKEKLEDQFRMRNHVCDECKQVFFINEPAEEYEGFKRVGPLKKLVCPGCLITLKNE